MVMLERVPDGERVTEMALAGWCIWTARDWQLSRRKRQRSSGSLERISVFRLWLGCYIADINCSSYMESATDRLDRQTHVEPTIERS